MAFQHPNSFNSFVPQATGQIIAYSRDPASYRINEYAQLVKAPTTVFVWYKLHRDDMGSRIVNTREDVWVDGAKRPENHNKMRFDTVEAQTIRRNQDFLIGWIAQQVADLPLLMMHSNMARNLIMTARTKRAVDLLETPGSWDGNTATATALNGGAGTWDLASSTAGANYLGIKKTLDKVRELILLGTNSAVNYNEEAPKLLISPGLAQKISQTTEIHDYLAQSPYALAQVTGREPGQNSRWGLPDNLYGYDLEIEESSIVSERPQADGDHASSTVGSPPPRRFLKSDDSAVVLSRVGGLDGRIGPNFSTLQIYYFDKELALETMDETWHKRTLGSVVEHTREVLAAPASGYLIQDTLS